MDEIDLPRVVFVRDEPGEPIRLCATNLENPNLQTLTLQEAMALIEDLTRAVQVRLR